MNYNYGFQVAFSETTDLTTLLINMSSGRQLNGWSGVGGGARGGVKTTHKIGFDFKVVMFSKLV